MAQITTRPWGSFEILYDGADCKVKRIIVNPGQRLSLQSHQQRSEIWAVVSGSGCAYVATNQEYVAAGNLVRIPLGAIHRIANIHVSEPLVFIETQLGTSFDEADIVRYEDDYGRVQ